MLEKDFKSMMISIKNEIEKTQVLIMSDANKRLIDLYFKLGKIIAKILNGETDLLKH